MIRNACTYFIFVVKMGSVPLSTPWRNGTLRAVASATAFPW
jgi:hypothetical protein